MKPTSARTTKKPKFVLRTVVLLAILVTTLVWLFSSDPMKPSHQALPEGNGSPAISLGEHHGLILAADGSLWTWGSDDGEWPVLGLGNRINQTTSLRRIGSEANWKNISAGPHHNLAVKSDGTLWTWGKSVQDRNTRASAIRVPILAAPGHEWKQAAAGGIHSVGLKTDGTLWAWGNNWSGAVGIDSTNGCSTPLQVGSATNWIKVWAGILETVAMQSDGSLWYWGENPNPAFDQETGHIAVPARISPDTNWVDVGFGVNTVFAIKADGTLWAWGRQAHVYTGVSDLTQDVRPTRVGTNSDWQSISSSGWWCQGLIKKDGTLWLMDASDKKPNGPQNPYPPVQFRRIEFPTNYVTYAGGAIHYGPGSHGDIEVTVTSKGEVWTRGVVAGAPRSFKFRVRALTTRLANNLLSQTSSAIPDPVYRKKPWQLEIVTKEPVKN